MVLFFLEIELYASTLQLWNGVTLLRLEIDDKIAGLANQKNVLLRSREYHISENQ